MDEVGLIPLLAVIISVNHGFVHICMCHRLSYHSECSTKCVIQCSHYVCVTRLLHKEAKGDGGGVTCQANDQVQDRKKHEFKRFLLCRRLCTIFKTSQSCRQLVVALKIEKH